MPPKYTGKLHPVHKDLNWKIGTDNLKVGDIIVSGHKYETADYYGYVATIANKDRHVYFVDWYRKKSGLFFDHQHVTRQTGWLSYSPVKKIIIIVNKK